MQEFIKIRILYLLKNRSDCISKIYALEGIGGFFKGMEATIWRHALWNGGYFGVIQ